MEESVCYQAKLCVASMLLFYFLFYFLAELERVAKEALILRVHFPAPLSCFVVPFCLQSAFCSSLLNSFLPLIQSYVVDWAQSTN